MRAMAPIGYAAMTINQGRPAINPPPRERRVMAKLVICTDLHSPMSIYEPLLENTQVEDRRERMHEHGEQQRGEDEQQRMVTAISRLQAAVAACRVAYQEGFEYIPVLAILARETDGRLLEEEAATLAHLAYGLDSLASDMYNRAVNDLPPEQLRHLHQLHGDRALERGLEKREWPRLGFRLMR